MNYKVYKWCGVPQCTNTSIKTPNKLFVYVPHKKTRRNMWLKLARRDLTGILPTTHLYFCEDHFDLPNDMENYMEYHLMGSVAQIRMKQGCIPTKFYCQPDRRKRTSDTIERQYILKKQRKMAIEQCEKEIEERTTVATKQLELEETELGETSFGSSADSTKPTSKDDLANSKTFIPSTKYRSTFKQQMSLDVGVKQEPMSNDLDVDTLCVSDLSSVKMEAVDESNPHIQISDITSLQVISPKHCLEKSSKPPQVGNSADSTKPTSKDDLANSKTFIPSTKYRSTFKQQMSLDVGVKQEPMSNDLDVDTLCVSDLSSVKMEAVDESNPHIQISDITSLQVISPKHCLEKSSKPPQVGNSADSTKPTSKDDLANSKTFIPSTTYRSTFKQQMSVDVGVKQQPMSNDLDIDTPCVSNLSSVKMEAVDESNPHIQISDITSLQEIKFKMEPMESNNLQTIEVHTSDDDSDNDFRIKPAGVKREK